jgi:crotonobetainyl-CoA:carnitine CoA-transferase CaiB-like acyl-CoA transferase
MWNRGKRSVVLDLADPAAVPALRALIGATDVLIEDLAPPAAARLGLEPAALASARPDLVRCTISAFGPADDAYPGLRADDGVVSAVVGRMAETDRLNGAVPGQDRRWPIFTAAPVTAYGAAQRAVQGVLALLVQRSRTGRGGHVRTSLAEAWVAFLMRHELARGDRPPGERAASEVLGRGLELCFLTAECADGRFIQMCARQDAHFRAWLEVLGLGRVLDEPRFRGAPLGIGRLEDVAALEELLRAAMRTRTQAEWMRLFTEEVDVGADPFLTPEEFLAHPQLTANERVVVLEDPEVGRIRQIGPLVAMAVTPARIGPPAPRLGEHQDLLTVRAAGGPPVTPSRPPAVAGLPLAGVTVLEAAYFVAGPLAGSLLAELGARVIKLEPPAGDPFRRTGLQSVKFLHGKESIAVDLKHPDGVAVAHRLVCASDAFVHSFRPGVPERLGLDHPTLAALNPGLVYLNAASYGSRGPQRHRAAFHSTPTALSGGGIAQAGRGNPPVDDSYPDPGSALAAATALLLGLAARERIGSGQYLETTMLTSTGYILSDSLVDYAGMPQRPIPDGGQHGLHPLYRLYRTAEGWLFLAVAGEDDWARFANAVNRPGWLAEGPRGPSEEVADGPWSRRIGAVLEGAPAAAWQRELQAAGLSAVEVTGRGSADWLAEHDLLSPDEHPAFGPYWRLPPTLRIAGVTAARQPAAALGEHSIDLLRFAGYGEREIGALLAAGTVRQCDEELRARPHR